MSLISGSSFRTSYEKQEDHCVRILNLGMLLLGVVGNYYTSFLEARQNEFPIQKIIKVLNTKIFSNLFHFSLGS